jgi:hypothetical protein
MCARTPVNVLQEHALPHSYPSHMHVSVCVCVVCVSVPTFLTELWLRKPNVGMLAKTVGALY